MTDDPELPDDPALEGAAEDAPEDLPDDAAHADADEPAEGMDNVVSLRRGVPSEPDATRACPLDMLVPAVEACLFAVTGVVTVPQLAAALKVPERHVTGALAALEHRLLATNSGIRLLQIADGYQLRTDLRLAPWVAAIRGGKPFRLTRPANETLAIIAFRQPVTKGVLDDIRGVDCGGVLRMLADRGLIRTDGRADEPGRPLNWVTTPAFLELFGLRSLADLPTLKDLRALGEDEGTGPEHGFPAPDEVERIARLLRPGPRDVTDE